MKKISLFFIAIFLMFLLSACAQAEPASNTLSESAGDSYTTDNTDPEEPAPTVTDPQISGGDVLQTAAIPALADRKIIYTANMTMDVEDLETTYNGIVDILDTYTAYIESANIVHSVYTFKIRVLSDNFDDLVGQLKTSGDMISFVKTSEDVTNSYSTFEARLAALEAQHDRIVELLSTASDLDTILELEQARFEIETQLNEVGETLANYDSLVDFSTINVTLREATEAVVVLPKTDAASLSMVEIGKNAAQVQVYNLDTESVVINLDLYQNGEFIRQYEETALGDSKAIITIGDLDSFKEYTVKATVIAEGHLKSYESTLRFETEKTFWNKITNVFIVSYESLLRILELVSFMVVALIPYAVLGVVIFIPLRLAYKKGMFDRLLKKKKQNREQKVNPMKE